MGRRARYPTLPQYPKLLAQRSGSFITPVRPAAFPSLPLTCEVTPVTKIDSEVKENPSQRSDAELEVESEDSNTQMSPHEATPGEPSVSNLDPIGFSLSTRVEWDTLELSGQYFIFTELIRRLPDSTAVAITLGLTYRELEAIEYAINLKSIYPASVDEIWDHCVAKDGIGDSAMTPDTLEKYMGYLVSAGRYEDVSAAGLEATQVFLRQHGLDIVLSNAFKHRFGESLNVVSQPSVGSFQGADTISTAQILETGSAAQTVRRSSRNAPKRRLSEPLDHSPDGLSQSQFLRTSQSLNSRHARISTTFDAVDHSKSGHSHPYKRRRIEAADTSAHKLSLRNHVKSTAKASLSDDEYSPSPRSNSPDFQSSDIEQTRLSTLSLKIDHETGRASVVGLPRRLPIRAASTRSAIQHPFHDPSAFAPHFNFAGFPTAERSTLLAIDPRMMTATGFWLVYGNRDLQAQFKDFMESLTPLITEYEPRTILLEHQGIQNRSLCFLIQLHNDWVQGGMWQSGSQDELLGHFERISIIGLENVKSLADIDIGALQSFEHIDPTSKQSWQSLDPKIMQRTLRAGVIRRYECGVLASRTRYEREVVAYNASHGNIIATSSLLEPGFASFRLAPSITDFSNTTLHSPKATDPLVFTRASDQHHGTRETGRYGLNLQQLQDHSSKKSYYRSSQPRQGLSLTAPDEGTVNTVPFPKPPERPCYSPISDFGGTLPEWTLNEEV